MRLEPDVGAAPPVRRKRERRCAAKKEPVCAGQSLRNWAVAQKMRLHISRERQLLNSGAQEGH